MYFSLNTWQFINCRLAISPLYSSGCVKTYLMIIACTFLYILEGLLMHCFQTLHKTIYHWLLQVYNENILSTLHRFQAINIRLFFLYSYNAQNNLYLYLG
jgi:hypothetical protein